MVSPGILQKRAQQRSKSRQREKPRQSILLLARCEGDTDVAYVKSLARELGLRQGEIDVKKSGVPKTCVEAALEDQSRIDKEVKVLTAAVCDVDAHPNIPHARGLARSKGILFVLSIPCIELWFLLHFREQSAHVERDAAERALRAELPQYEKGKSAANPPSEKRSEAVARAKSLRRKHEEDGSPPDSNPSSRMDELIDGIVELAKKAKGEA